MKSLKIAVLIISLAVINACGEGTIKDDSIIGGFIPDSGGGGDAGAGLGGGGDGTIEDPERLNVGTSYNRNIGSGGTQYYVFTTGSIDSTHTISLTQTDSDLSWALFSDPLFSNFIDLCDNFLFGAADEICTTFNPLLGGTDYYLRVTEWDNIAGGYTLLIDTP